MRRLVGEIAARECLMEAWELAVEWLAISNATFEKAAVERASAARVSGSGFLS